MTVKTIDKTTIKKISELEKLTNLSFSSNVIIEENGKAKRFNANNIGKVKTVNGIEPDDYGNIDIEIPEIEMPEINYPVTSVNGMTGDVVIEVGGGGETTQPDWNQNDESATDYVKNRTHWTEHTRITITNQTELVCNDSDENIANCFWTNDFYVPALIRGDSYVVTWDGIEYECVAKDDCYGGNALGNFEIVNAGEDTEEPFFIYEEYDIYDSAYCGIATTNSEVHTIKIEHLVQIVHTLDEKFIPDNIARIEDITKNIVQPDWNQNDDTAPDYVKNRTHYAHRETLFPETEITMTEDVGQWRTEAYIEFNIKDSYIVTINGVEYLCSLGTDKDGAVYYWDFQGENMPVHVSSYASGIDYGVGVFVDFDGIENPVYGTYTVSVHAAEEIIKQLDEKYIPDTIARTSEITAPPVTSVNGMTGDVVIEVGGGGTSLQADLAQNDETAPDYVKNRTHWIESNEEVTLLSGTFDFSDRFAEIPSEYDNLVIGNVYNVVWDGVEYTGLLCFDDGGYPTIGSPYDSITDDSITDDMPFCVWTETLDGGVIFGIQANDYSEIHDISIIGDVFILHKLDEKFIPDTIARAADVRKSVIIDLDIGEEDPENPGYYPNCICSMDDDYVMECLLNDVDITVRLKYDSNTSVLLPHIKAWNNGFYQVHKFLHMSYDDYMEHLVEFNTNDCSWFYMSFQLPVPYLDPIPDATGETVSAAEFNALLAALRNAGYIMTE